jgi:hypothetical protein
MAELFTTEWIVDFSKLWNTDEEMDNYFFTIGFDSIIGYGFIGEDKPRAVLMIEEGKVISAGRYRNQELNWDLRASKESWLEWVNEGFGVLKLGTVVASGKLQFLAGDYHRMIRNPSLAKAFLRHFELMGRVKTS